MVSLSLAMLLPQARRESMGMYVQVAQATGRLFRAPATFRPHRRRPSPTAQALQVRLCQTLPGRVRSWRLGPRDSMRRHGRKILNQMDSLNRAVFCIIFHSLSLVFHFLISLSFNMFSFYLLSQSSCCPPRSDMLNPHYLCAAVKCAIVFLLHIFTLAIGWNFRSRYTQTYNHHTTSFSCALSLPPLFSYKNALSRSCFTILTCSNHKLLYSFSRPSHNHNNVDSPPIIMSFYSISIQL